MESLEKYGKVIREYYGDGFATLDNGKNCKCSVCMAQLANGKIMASCHFSETAIFIVQAYPSYVSLKDKYGLEKGIEAYLDAKNEGVYFETRALVAAVLLEFLSDRYATKDNRFRRNIETMLKGLGILASQADLDKLTKIRNSLAHNASFINNITKEYWPAYAFLIGTLDKIFLKILNYSGTFLDITNEFNRIDIKQIRDNH